MPDNSFNHKYFIFQEISVKFNGRVIRYMKTSYAILVLLLSMSFNYNSFSQHMVSGMPASPYPLEVIQFDGSILQVLGKGDESFSYSTTLDGYCIIKNNSNIYEYAIVNKDMELVPSGIQASDAEDRTGAETEFLENLDPEMIQSILEGQAQNQVLKSTDRDLDTRAEEAFPSSGDRRVLLLLIEYPDLDNTYSVADFDNFMNQTNYNGTGSFRDYFADVSRDQLILTTDVYGWYVAANNYLYYGRDNGYEVSDELVRC